MTRSNFFCLVAQVGAALCGICAYCLYGAAGAGVVAGALMYFSLLYQNALDAMDDRDQRRPAGSSWFKTGDDMRSGL